MSQREKYALVLSTKRGTADMIIFPRSPNSPIDSFEHVSVKDVYTGSNSVKKHNWYKVQLGANGKVIKMTDYQCPGVKVIKLDDGDDDSINLEMVVELVKEVEKNTWIGKACRQSEVFGPVLIISQNKIDADRNPYTNINFRLMDDSDEQASTDNPDYEKVLLIFKGTIEELPSDEMKKLGLTIKNDVESNSTNGESANSKLIREKYEEMDETDINQLVGSITKILGNPSVTNAIRKSDRSLYDKIIKLRDQCETNS